MNVSLPSPFKHPPIYSAIIHPSIIYNHPSIIISTHPLYTAIHSFIYPLFDILKYLLTTYLVPGTGLDNLHLIIQKLSRMAIVLILHMRTLRSYGFKYVVEGHTSSK